MDAWMGMKVVKSQRWTDTRRMEYSTRENDDGGVSKSRLSTRRSNS